MTIYQKKEMVSSLFKLYRLDVAVISFGSYAAGLVLSGGIRWVDLLLGLGISLISFNYIYSLNSIEDRHIDLVNKPQRPIPAGKLPLEVAKAYVNFLLALSIIYPFLIQADIINLALLLLLPLLGWAYSMPPLHLKAKAIPAMASIALMYTTPMAVAFNSRFSLFSASHVILLTYIFLFCLSIVPLKDIEDVEGDVLYSSGNFLALLGMGRLFMLSIAGLMATIALATLVELSFVVTFALVILPTSIIFLIVLFFRLRRPIKRLYRSILILIAGLGLVFSVGSLYFGVSL